MAVATIVELAGMVIVAAMIAAVAEVPWWPEAYALRAADLAHARCELGDDGLAMEAGTARGRTNIVIRLRRGPSDLGCGTGLAVR